MYHTTETLRNFYVSEALRKLCKTQYGATKFKIEDPNSLMYSFFVPPNTSVGSPPGGKISYVQPYSNGLMIIVKIEYPDYFLKQQQQ